VQSRDLAKAEFGMLSKKKKRQSDMCRQDLSTQRIEALTNSERSSVSVMVNGQEKRVCKVKLRRPPRPDALLLVISSFGVYEVEAELTATVADLRRELISMRLHDGIPEDRIRLRTGPHVQLESDDLLGRLLPGLGGASGVTTIYIQAKLTLGDEAKITTDGGETLEGNEVVEKWIGELGTRPPWAALVLLRTVWDLFGCHCTGWAARVDQAQRRIRDAKSIMANGRLWLEGDDDDDEEESSSDDSEEFGGRSQQTKHTDFIAPVAVTMPHARQRFSNVTV